MTISLNKKDKETLEEALQQIEDVITFSYGENGDLDSEACGVTELEQVNWTLNALTEAKKALQRHKKRIEKNNSSLVK